MPDTGEAAAAAEEDPVKGITTSYPENNEDTDTEPAMLEDEEMPTYMSLTSSSRPDESRAGPEVDSGNREDDSSEKLQGKANRAASPCTSDHQESGSIYVVSSGEESGRAYDDQDFESDEMELEEEEEEDDSRPGYNDEDEEDSDNDMEPEQFERSSDDFVLRYDTGLEKHHKARSRSLQDLTNSRGNSSRFGYKRRSIDMMGHYKHGTEFPRDPLADERKSVKPSRYADVPSKVKLYIQSIKEQSKRSAELRNRETHMHKNFTESRGGNTEISCTSINPANRLIKGYAQNVLNCVTAPDVKYVGGRRLGENEPESESIDAASLSKRQLNDKKSGLETELIPDNRSETANSLGKRRKINGIIDYSAQNLSDEPTVAGSENSATNGQEQMAAIFNLRTLSYEEYANGDQASNSKTETDEMLLSPLQQKNGLPEMVDEKEAKKILSTSESETARVPGSLKTAAPEEARVETEATNCDNPDVAMLWAMLNQKAAQYNEKTAQYDGIRDAFQKTLTENISLKRQLDELKKTLAAQSRPEIKPRETRVASVQTDESIPGGEKTDDTEAKISGFESKPATMPPKQLLSSSIGSALSSIEQWSDSNCSPAISINPPNFEQFLNSDDSMTTAPAAERTPRRHVRALSRSFITSSRILQTLANITQGRTKTTSPLARRATNNEQGQSQRESNCSPLPSGNGINEARTRKRKASDMLGFSKHPETFKIPCTPDVPRKKVNSDSDTDGGLKSSREPTAAGASKDGENEDRQSDLFHDTEATDVPENIKCFVYREDADSNERSFLIQTEEPSKNSDVGEKGGGGTVRECGPYLLGNVEIRMSEANGTINIWGKEVTQESEYVGMDQEEEEEEEPEEEEDPCEDPSLSRRESLEDSKMPRAKLINGRSPFVCSTNKKSKASPHFVRSSIGKYFRPALSNLARVNALVNEGEAGRYGSCPILSNRPSPCDQCESQKKIHLDSPNCNHSTNPRRKQHSCCRRQEVQVNERDCDCARDCRILDDDAILETVTNILSSHKKFTTAFDNRATNYCCANHGSEEACRHHTLHHRRSCSPDQHEGDCHHAKKRCSSCTGDLPSCNSRLTPGNTGCCNKRSRSHSHASSCDDEERPLLQNGHYETPEIKRRRLSGKKVRGILTDLLRGCGGCRDHNVSFEAKESASLPNIIPTVRLTPCTPPQQSSSKSATACASHSKDPSPREPINQKSCSSCSRRVEMAAEIESKLEFLTVEMERLRSRSDTFRGMLNLLNADTN